MKEVMMGFFLWLGKIIWSIIQIFRFVTTMIIIGTLQLGCNQSLVKICFWDLLLKNKDFIILVWINRIEDVMLKGLGIDTLHVVLWSVVRFRMGNMIILVTRFSLIKKIGSKMNCLLEIILFLFIHHGRVLLENFPIRFMDQDCVI